MSPKPITEKTTRPAHRFHIDSRLSLGAELQLPGRVGRHIAALRLQEGDELTLFDGHGGEYAARLTRWRGNEARAKVLSWADTERESSVSVTLALGVSAGDRMDYAVQKATELGVQRIVALDTSRSVVKLSGARAEKRLAHWLGIAVAACEQCGRNRVPAMALKQFDEFLGEPRAGLGLLLALEADRRLADLPRASAVSLLIGPEGGLSREEHARAVHAGFQAIRFGPRVLRTETAPLAVIAAVQSHWGDC